MSRSVCNLEDKGEEARLYAGFGFLWNLRPEQIKMDVLKQFLWRVKWPEVLENYRMVTELTVKSASCGFIFVLSLVTPWCLGTEKINMHGIFPGKSDRTKDNNWIITKIELLKNGPMVSKWNTLRMWKQHTVSWRQQSLMAALIYWELLSKSRRTKNPRLIWEEQVYAVVQYDLAVAKWEKNHWRQKQGHKTLKISGFDGWTF